ncbi:MAG: DEAD/DEAH box helicase [Phycisphaerae bacterium]|nr:DEAD/DEAH box helicase [Phycisphaerae bacterium]
MMKLRKYQQQAIDAVYDYLRNNDGNPCIVLPTAAGKSHVLAQICADAVTLWNGRVLVLTHVKELIEQNAEKISYYLDNKLTGIYSAGLNSRDTDKPVIVAGIQSVYKRACELGHFELIIIDESHLLNPDSETMYQQFLTDMKAVNPDVRVIGLTATPFRLKGGMICSEENILNEVCFEIGVKELISQGYLCPLKSKAGKRKADTSGLHIRGGEFIASEVEQLMDDNMLVDSACREIIEQTIDRNSVLIFAASVKHATHIQKTLKNKTGLDIGLVTGETSAIDRAEILARFKGESIQKDFFSEPEGPLKYLVNVNVLTTGFDAPNIDCVVLLRPTNSPGLYVQMLGRGFRLHESKDDCLILDFGGNIIRHGPVDALQIKNRSSGSGSAPAKECPDCQALIHAGYSKCPECDYEFPASQKNSHDSSAASAGVLSGQYEDTQYDVKDIAYHFHMKRNATADTKPTMRVQYQIGWKHWQSEWICFEHSGYARTKAENWWKARSDMPVPDTINEAIDLANAGVLAPTSQITIRTTAGDKYDKIVDCVLGDKHEVIENCQERETDMMSEYNWPEDGIPF